MDDNSQAPVNRRNFFAMVGRVAGTAVMYEAMASLAHAAESTFQRPIELRDAPRGASVLILGAGLAGMVAAYELRKAGYQVQILEYQDRAGGRSWSLYGGDAYTELGGFRQDIAFDKGLYFNPGPWRIPHHHKGVLHYAKLLGVKLEPFVQDNQNAYLHSTKAFGGKPQRFRAVYADFEGHVAELLSKSVQQNQLDNPLTREDRERLLETLRSWGTLDKDYKYVRGDISAARRGYDHPPGGGLDAFSSASEPLRLDDLLKAELWNAFGHYNRGYEYQPTMFQPVGGMGMIGRAFGQTLDGVIRYNAKVIDITQNKRGVTATFVDRIKGGPPQQARADWCVCTIPASVLSQIPMNVGAKLQSAINALPYGASAKVGLQMKRRFWEEDEGIYGGITLTDMPNSMIGYPSSDFFSSGKGVLLGAYGFLQTAVEMTALSPQERIAQAVACGAAIHPQYRQEFEMGASVAWHRVPWALGCYGDWTEEKRAEHYSNMCQIDGRIVLAGEHVSTLPAWQEGAVLSSLDAIARLHKHIVQR